KDIEHVTILNTGKVSAHSLHAHIEISWNHLPDLKRIKLLDTVEINPPDELRAEGRAAIHKYIPLHIGRVEWNAMENRIGSVVVRGFMTYEMGVEHTRQVTFCQAYIAVHAPRSPPQLQWPTNVPTCDQVPYFLSLPQPH